MSTSSNAGAPARDRDRDRLSDHDKSIIGQAHQLVGVPGPAVDACFGSIAVSYDDTAHAYAEALGEALDDGEQFPDDPRGLADDGAGVTVSSERDEPLDCSQPESAGQAGMIRARPAIVPGDIMLIRPRTYEITFLGRADAVLRAAFDDCTVTTSPGLTTLRAQLPDQAALWGLVQRIIGLGLDVVDLHLGAGNSVEQRGDGTVRTG